MDRRTLAGVILALILGFGVVGSALAHAKLVSSDPKHGAKLDKPPAKITLVFSEELGAEKSGFTVSNTTGTKVGEGTSVQWPNGIGGKGNEGVAAYVKQLKGAIGYVELAYALQNKMTYAAMRNGAGNWVQPNAETFAAAAAAADWKNARDFNLVITDAPGANAWPIAATNFILMHKQPDPSKSGDAKRSRDALDFFKWALENGQPQAQALDYVPLPKELVQQVEQYWATEFKH